MADNAPGSAPDSPLELGATGWRRTLARGVRKYLRDRCGMMAGSLAFHWFLSLFPAQCPSRRFDPASPVNSS